ncbi:hypothetical protein FT663_03217 [Candidozyma haemuli var. vulneris]|uniref:Guanine nucleotide-binding protein subunit alpha n=1 Tax=Candidozyma haemuli TaxID=45357 RepID=A0A2V1AVX8_9ASCO|nr:hypothetical protein CXQ85_004674 [[Candida] haemuloni]KAF3988718.1 hypothetical protein FT662_03246 [[Candida] haemuloni var. vulneris]KAF3990364.1 hypothetical protein FT663_03217 [[Candida] haemuloni var. vulneris]PVH22008.1 hypothetical protein CXQ85_004674 [[Candida] haemuloni]
MGCAVSTPQDEDDQTFLQQRLISEAIDRSLNVRNESQKKVVKMFLLGAGESGKSTVLKQMRLLHHHSFTDFERRQYTDVIWMDLIESMKKLIFNARKLRIPLDSDQPGSSLTPYKRVLVNATSVSENDPSGNSITEKFAIGYKDESRKQQTDLLGTGYVSDTTDTESNVSYQERKTYTNEEIAEAITQLWKHDKGVRKCFERANEFQLESSAAYYFDNVFKFSNPSYRCSDQDVIMGRIKTTGITENDFNIKNMTFKVLDAGGQRSERKKWIHCFQDIDAVLFVLAVSEYDQTLYEDERVNRMKESLMLFEALCNSKWFKDTPFILFLNKVDLLEEKLQRSPITQYFPNFEGNPSSVNEVLDYFEGLLLNLNRTSKPIYVHRTCATDTKAMGFVLSAATDVVIQQNLRESGLI